VYVVKNGRRVEELREEKGLSKQDLARAAGINPGTLRRIEREEPVQLKTGKKVAGALEVNYQSICQPYYTPEEIKTWVADTVDRARAFGHFPDTPS
jgi:transcriptional regulator with XRE-family HTH domain